jgi:hypothetical protein
LLSVPSENWLKSSKSRITFSYSVLWLFLEQLGECSQAWFLSRQIFNKFHGTNNVSLFSEVNFAALNFSSEMKILMVFAVLVFALSIHAERKATIKQDVSEIESYTFWTRPWVETLSKFLELLGWRKPSLKKLYQTSNNNVCFIVLLLSTIGFTSSCAARVEKLWRNQNAISNWFQDIRRSLIWALLQIGQSRNVM